MSFDATLAVIYGSSEPAHRSRQSHWDWDDVRQEAAIAAWESYADQDVAYPVNLGSRLLHFRHLELLEHGSRRKRGGQMEAHALEASNEPATEVESVLGTLCGEEDSQALWAAVDRLPATQAQALRLRYCDGLSHIEIAKALGVTKMAASGLLKRGLIALRAEYAC